MKWLHKQWLQLPLIYRKETVSFIHTFLTVFGAAIVLGITDGPMLNTKELFIALLVSASRTALKAAWNDIAKYDEK